MGQANLLSQIGSKDTNPILPIANTTTMPLVIPGFWNNMNWNRTLSSGNSSSLDLQGLQIKHGSVVGVPRRSLEHLSSLSNSMTAQS